MVENQIVKKNLLNRIVSFTKSNFKIITILVSICFVFLLFFQIYSFYSLKKIQNNSVTYFNLLNLEEIDSNQDLFLKLSKQDDFYGILSKLEIIEINYNNKNYQIVIDLYNELLENEKIDNIYKSAIATKASYKIIDISSNEVSEDYLNEINNFISNIDDSLINYQGVKLELNYLVKILEAERKNIIYLNNNEAIDLYESIMNSNNVTSSTKERINKIHEFYSYK